MTSKSETQATAKGASIAMTPERARKTETLHWNSYVKGVFDEIATNDSMAIMRVPLKITYELLQQVAARAIELDDYELNCLMIRLGLYSINDQESPDFDPKKARAYLARKPKAEATHDAPEKRAT